MMRNDQADAPVTPPTGEAPTPGRRRPVLSTSWRRLRTEALWAASSGAAALAGAVLVLRLWRGHLNIPLGASGDLMLALSFAKNMRTTGWFQGTPQLGAPFGQDLTAYPVMAGDTWNAVGLKLLTLFLSPAASVNVFFLLGFPLAAVAAYGSLRLLRVNAPTAAALGAVYAWLPYHFLRSEWHLFLSAYFAVPVACAVAVLLYRSRIVPWSGRRPTPAFLAALGAAVLLAGTGMYYAVFSMLLWVAASVLAALEVRSWRRLVPGALLTGVTGLVLVLAALPNLLHDGGAAADTAVEGRTYGATEFYGLKLTNLLLPMPMHRIAALGGLRARTADSPIPGEGSEMLGILGATGLVVVVLAVLIPATARRLGLVERLRPLGALTVVSLLCAMVAGVNSLLAVAGFAELRAWNRMSVVIAFFALAGFGLVLDAVGRRLTSRRPGARQVVAVGLAGAVGLVGLYDQTSPAFIPDHAGTAALWNSDAEYFAAVEESLGAGALVFQLPYARFPENPPIVAMTDYSHLRGYLHSDLRWSYGGIKGEESEWQPVALQDGLTAALPALVSAGFEAAYVNRLGYEDQGAAIEAELMAATGEPALLVDGTGTLAVYDLRGYARTLDPDDLPDRDAVLYPVRLQFGAGTYGEEVNPDETFRWAQATAELGVVNPAPTARKVLVTGTIRVAGATSEVVVAVDGEETRLRAVGGTVRVEIPVEVGPGVTDITVTTDSPATPTTPNDARDLRQQLVGLQVTLLD